MGHGEQAAVPGRRQRSTRTSCTSPATSSPSPTPGAGKTTFALRLATRAARAARHRARHRRRTHRAPQDASGPTPPTGSASGSTRRLHATPTARYGRDYDGVAVTYAQVAERPTAAPGRHRAASHPGHPRRGAPRRRRASAGARPSARRSSPRPGGCASPARRSGPTPRRSRSSPTRPAGTASAGRRPTTPTATAARCATASCGRSSSWPTRGTMRWRTKAGDEVLGPPRRAAHARTSPRTAWRTRSTPRASGSRPCWPPRTAG